MPIFGHAHARPDVVAHPLHAQPALLAGKDVEADLGPVVDSLRDLDGLVFGVIGGRNAIECRMAFGSEVRVQLDHRGARRHRVSAVDLNLVVTLRAGGGGRAEEEKQGKGSWGNSQAHSSDKGGRYDALLYLKRFERDWITPVRNFSREAHPPRRATAWRPPRLCA